MFAMSNRYEKWIGSADAKAAASTVLVAAQPNRTG
jgi:hypothetical protein